MSCCGIVEGIKGRYAPLVFEPLGGILRPPDGNLGPAWLVRRGSFFVRHVYWGDGFVSLAVIRCWVCGGLCVYRRPKGHPMGYQLGKSATRAGAGAGVLIGLACVRGVWVCVRGVTVSAR